MAKLQFSANGERHPHLPKTMNLTYVPENADYPAMLHGEARKVVTRNETKEEEESPLHSMH